MNIFFCGQRSFGKDVLVALHEAGHNIVGVAPPPQDKYYDKIIGAAMIREIPIISDCDRLTSKDIPENTDLIVAAHSHWYISNKILENTTYGGIGYHPSILPRHRGKDAVRWTIAMGDPIAGGTVYWLNDKVDGGDILNQYILHVDRKWDHKDLWKRLFPLGVEAMVNAVKSIEDGTAQRITQDERFATWEPSFENKRLKRNELIMLE